MNTSIDIKKIFELIDLYKYASIEGERVEIIITPFDEDGKWDDTKRKITIGLQNGLSRDRDTFIVENAREFDREALPQLLAYFSCDDKLGSWYITTPSLENQTFKGYSDTQNGNTVYLETFDEGLYDLVKEQKEDIEQKTTYKNNSLTDNDKVWDEIILYAKQRRIAQDFFNDAPFTDEEKNTLYELVVNLSKVKEINISNSRKSKENNEKYFTELFNNRDRLLSLGLTEELINKVIDNSLVKKMAKLTSSEKRIRRRVDIANPIIQSKIDFATHELGKVDYFDLKNATLTQYETDQLEFSQPGAIKKLIEIEEKEEYKNYCSEILTYLENKSNNNKKIVETKVELSNLLFEEYDDAIVDSYGKFNEAIELVTQGKLDDEHYEIVVENGYKNKDMRRVRISITDGVSRNDTFNFLFTDGENFDKEFVKRIDEIAKNDPKFISQISFADVPGIEGFLKTSLHTTQKNNEILIKNDDKLLLNKTKTVVEDKNLESNIEIKDSSLNEEDIIAKLKKLEKEIIETARRQDRKFDTTVSFEQMHEFVKKYIISNSNGPLQIFNRETHEEYIPETEEDKRNIEFAIYWATKAGLNESVSDVVSGEQYAFSEESKKLFNLFEVQFKESIRRGIDVDLESLREQFHVSGVKNADTIYERLFQNKYYFEYVLEYYRRSLGESKSNDYNLKELGDLTESTKELAKMIESRKEYEEIQQSAQTEAERLNSREIDNQELSKAVQELVGKPLKEKGKATEALLEQRRKLLETLEKIKAKNGGAEQAAMLLGEAEKEDLVKKSSAEALSLRGQLEKSEVMRDAPVQAAMLFGLDGKQIATSGGLEQALDIIDKEDKKDIKRSAPVQAAMLFGQDGKQIAIEGAEAQADLIMSKAKEEQTPSMFEIDNEETTSEELDSQLKEIKEYYEMVNYYSTPEQSPTIKINANTENDEETKEDEEDEVVISNGFGEDEKIVYDRSFDRNELIEKIMPFLCGLFVGSDSKLEYDRIIENPSHHSYTLTALGENGKSFIVTSDDEDFVKKCDETLKRELYNNKNTEKEKEDIATK